MSLYLIRHGKTRGNLEGRYIGCRSDEPLCAEGLAELRARRYPAADRVFSSPLRRCVETARLLYPRLEPVIVRDFRECDFGAFEGKNYRELNGRADYQAWIDSGGEKPFPGGESRAEFAKRCVRAFEGLRVFDSPGRTALVVHGGTVMAIMEAYARPRASYFDFQLRCAQGYVLREDGSYALLEAEPDEA